MIFRLLKEKFGCVFIYHYWRVYDREGMPQNRRVFGNATSSGVISMFKNTKIIFGKSKG